MINNVETFTFATAILARGVEWYQGAGDERRCSALKFVGISGDVNRPGVFEVPMGTKYSELIYEYAGGILEGRNLLALRAFRTFLGIPARFHG